MHALDLAKGPGIGLATGPVMHRSRGNAIRLGFWAALLTSLMATVMMILAMATPARSGPYCGSGCVPYPYTDVAAFVPQDYYWLYPGILLALSVVVLTACVRSVAKQGSEIFGRIGLSIAMLYAGIIVVDYFLQLAVIAPSLQAGETAGLSPFTQYNPHGVFIALEALGYLLLSTTLLFVAPVFSNERKQRVVRWLFLSCFALVALAFAVVSLGGYSIVAFEVFALLINWLVLIISGILLALIFRESAKLDLRGTRMARQGTSD